MVNAPPNVRWRSLRLICLATSICGLAAPHAAWGDGTSFGVAKEPFKRLAMAWVSDIHLQPYYSTLAHPKERCGTQKEEPVESTDSTGRKYLEMEAGPEFGRAGCGSSPRLFNETLNFLNDLVTQSHAETAAHRIAPSSTASAAQTAFNHYPLPPITTVLLTGDYVHSRKNVDSNYIKDALKEFTDGLFKRFPQQSRTLRQGHSQAIAAEEIQLLMVVGNHDFPPEALVPPQRTRWANILYDIWKPALPRGEITRSTFLRGMYYSTNLREAPQVRVLCMNTNLYAVKLRRAAIALLKSDRDETNGEEAAAPLGIAGEDAAEEADPAGQFEWLAGELRSARARGEQVIICGHIMPALTVRLNEFAYFRDTWESKYSARYRDIISAHSDIVVAQLYGHQHEGTIVTLLPAGTQAWKAAATAGPRCNPRQANLPTALLTTPSVSPQNGNNPAMRVLLFEALQDNHENSHRHEEQGSLGSYTLTDYTQYRLPLYGFVGNSGFGRKTPEFEFESSFQDTFTPFLRCAKPRQPPLEDAAEEWGRHATRGPPRCIDGSTALQIAEAVGRSPFAYDAYRNHRYAGGKDVASAAVSCSSLAMTERDFIECIYQIQ
ncbi:Acid sphingomyelinase-like phosphodiesterase 3b, related [Eimeria praecox]|uniref:Acid sphingomyelinase-like phosphodiesterase 3b, related n=1 Tax=Eimeria praecox TaxID=51316 RepID=U6H167_9EIME|nr:Acid sphingomyelinase-like phosphodiesterase 3b, related [Eimeria praecox]